MGSIPTRRTDIPKGTFIDTDERNRPPTGTPASEGERQAAKRLASELSDRGLRTEVEPVSVRTSEGVSVALHTALSLTGGLLGMKWPLLGAAICLAAAFSFYAERALGLLLIGRLIPRRSSQNVVSPPTGPGWNEGFGVVLCAGYDAPDSYPVGDWLARRMGGRLTTDRIVFWGGMIPLFAATMMRVAGIEGFGVELVQMLSSVVLVAIFAAQVDRGLSGKPVAVEDDLAAAEMVLEVVDDLLDSEEPFGDIAVCFFGSASASGAGAADFFKRVPAVLGKRGTAVITFIAGEESAEQVQITAREGDLATIGMNPDLGDESEIELERSILRGVTGNLAARRRGLRATSVIGRGEDAIVAGLDLTDAGLETAVAASPAAINRSGASPSEDDRDLDTSQPDEGSGASEGDPDEPARGAGKPAVPRKRNVTRN